MFFNLTEIFTCFLVLAAIIDIIGAVPIIIELKEKGNIIKPLEVSLVSFIVLVAFLLGGEGLLAIFNVDIHSFAVAGSIILLIYAFEMILGVTIMQNDGPKQAAAYVPLVFPLIAGAGALTTLIAMRADYQMQNIIVAIFLNMTMIYFVLKYVDWVKRVLGPVAVYILRKVFGIILLAIAVKMFTENLSTLF